MSKDEYIYRANNAKSVEDFDRIIDCASVDLNRGEWWEVVTQTRDYRRYLLGVAL